MINPIQSYIISIIYKRRNNVQPVKEPARPQSLRQNQAGEQTPNKPILTRVNIETTPEGETIVPVHITRDTGTNLDLYI